MLYNPDWYHTSDFTINQFWDGGVNYEAGNGDHLAVTIHEIVVTIGRFRLERLLMTR